MLSTNSLSAFSSATTTSAVKGQSNIRLVREPLSPVDTGRSPAKSAGLTALPTIAPPRGSLLNLSV